jgi:hypothetical protein
MKQLPPTPNHQNRGAEKLCKNLKTTLLRPENKIALGQIAPEQELSKKVRPAP